jgi:hypothetical protein
MADLSNLLGDVYGDDPDGEPVHREPSPRDRAPDWAEESVLDAAFANWVPGPPPDAPAAERDVFGPRPADPASAAPLPDDLAAALSAALVEAPPSDLTALPPPAPLPDADTAPPPAPQMSSLEPDAGAMEAGSWSELAAARRADADHSDPFGGALPMTARLPWQRGDDDILPRRNSPRKPRPGRSISLRRK